MNKKHILILAVLAVGIFALGVHLATAGPVEVQIGETTISFLPFVMTSKAVDGPSGVLYVFSSTETTDGNPGGREAMGEICFAEDPNSHFCTQQEIESAFFSTGVYFETTPLEFNWVDYIQTDDWYNETNNCFGWSDNDYLYSGRFLRYAGINTDITACNVAYQLACCKWIP